MAVSNVQSTYAALNEKSSVVTANEAGSADRFLKLLVAQMQNQDPLAPMDNAQVTSQMAQINTVTGIEKLNTTVQGLQGNFVQMQALIGIFSRSPCQVLFLRSRRRFGPSAARVMLPIPVVVTASH